MGKGCSFSLHYGSVLTGTGHLILLPTPNKTSARSDKSNPQCVVDRRRKKGIRYRGKKISSRNGPKAESEGLARL